MEAALRNMEKQLQQLGANLEKVGVAAASRQLYPEAMLEGFTDSDDDITGRRPLARVKTTWYPRTLKTDRWSQIISAPEFLVFCADLNRSSRCCYKHGTSPTEGFTEQFIIATVDTALYAQNVVVAAESQDLGICYIGAIRNDPTLATNLLNLPQNVYPVFGLCIGYPAEDPEVKPRLPLSVIVKENVYDSNDEKEQINRYDEIIRKYYAERSGNNKSQSWSEQMSGLLSSQSRPHMRAFLSFLRLH